MVTPFAWDLLEQRRIAERQFVSPTKSAECAVALTANSSQEDQPDRSGIEANCFRAFILKRMNMPCRRASAKRYSTRRSAGWQRKFFSWANPGRLGIPRR